MSFCRLNSDPGRRRGRRGVTLLEMLIAVALLSLLSTAAFTFFIGGMRTAGAILRHNLVAGYGRSPVEEMKNRIRTGTAVAIRNNGNLLEITNPDRSISSYWFDETDTSGTTTLGNSLMLRERTGAEARREARFLHRVGPGVPVFARTGLNGVTIRLRLGDAVGAARFGAYTRSYHSVNLVTTVSPRNHAN